MTTTAVLTGLGTYLPSRRVSNEELSGYLDTSDEWIRTRTGISQRYWAEAGVSTGDLAVEAGQRALKSAGLTAGDSVDMVIVATTTPDHPCPATAPDVTTRLGLESAAAFDISAVCSGFIYALTIASHALESGHANQVLVIGAETYSTILNPADRTTSVIFGDGAGAVLLRRGTINEPGAVHGFNLGSDGTGRSLIQVPAGGARQRSTNHEPDPADSYFTMQGKKVFANAVHRMQESATAVMHDVGWTTNNVDHLVGHQANVRILHALADQIGIDRQRAVINIDQVGNTSAASIPLALAHAWDQARFTPGDRLLLTAFGGGLTWGAAAMTWPDITPM